VGWIQVIQDRKQCLAFVKIVTSLWVLKVSGYFLIRKTIDFLLGTVPTEVTQFIMVIFFSN
jgi:hypothetical protein